MYRLHRVFCATPWELEGERRAFTDLIGEFNEAEAMKAGILYVPVSLMNVHDKRAYQYVVDENIRGARHYLVALTEDWGPRERNFERDYQLALKCRADAAFPMSETAILLQKQPDGTPPPFAATLGAMGLESIHFSGLEDFTQAVRELLSQWLAADIVRA